MTHPDPEDPVIQRSVMLRERLAVDARRLMDLTAELLEEAHVLRDEVSSDAERDPDGGPGT